MKKFYMKKFLYEKIFFQREKKNDFFHMNEWVINNVYIILYTLYVIFILFFDWTDLNLNFLYIVMIMNAFKYM
jgi:hypothetical protein